MNSYETLTTKSPLWESLPDTAAEKVAGGGSLVFEFDAKIEDPKFILYLQQPQLDFGCGWSVSAESAIVIVGGNVEINAAGSYS